MKKYDVLSYIAFLTFLNTVVSVAILISAGTTGVHPTFLVASTIYTLACFASWLYLWKYSYELAALEESIQKTISILGGQQGIDRGLEKVARNAKDARSEVKRSGLDMSSMTTKNNLGHTIYNEKADQKVKDAHSAQETFNYAVVAVQALGYNATLSIDYYAESILDSLPLPQSTDDVVLQQPDDDYHNDDAYEPVHLRTDRAHIRKVT
jgi:hypothetical protein